MEIIVPAAGLSTRFPGMRPKFTLTDYSGKLMLHRAIEPYIDIYPITVTILKEHDNKFNIEELIKDEISSKINVLKLERPTTGPADTVYQTIKKSKIDTNKSIFIKDCDSFFDHKICDGNYICVTKVRDHKILKHLAAKSFVISNNNGIVNSIIEKEVVSDTFCIGGYKFDTAEMFCKHFESLQMNEHEIFVSHIIQSCILQNNIFLEVVSENYIDVGTAQEWWEYNNSKPTIFCDIDGTVIVAAPRNKYHEPVKPLLDNVKVLLEKQTEGAQLIFTTARPISAYDITYNVLLNLGFKNFVLLAGLHNSKRILINDFNNSNPYPRAEAINIKRDTNDIREYLK
jgi:hypothetical protein